MNFQSIKNQLKLKCSEFFHIIHFETKEAKKQGEKNKVRKIN